MNSTPTYTIPGNPIPLKRARHANGHFYDEQSHMRLSIGLIIQSQKDEPTLIEGPIELDITFYFPMPKTLIKKHEQMKNTPHKYKPDLSNLIKFVEDVCTGILYKDDCLISTIIANKVYSDVPRTEFTIKEIK